MKKIIILLFSFIFVWWLCNADLAWYTINSYTSEYNLQKNGTLKVRETINVSFIERRHGIYRNIPYKYSNNYSTPIKNIKVLWENFTTSKDWNNFQIKIWDKNKTIIWNHEYIMEYDIKKTVRTFPWWQELYRNLLWLEWNTPVNNFSFKLQLPEDVKISDEDFYVVYWPKWSETRLNAHIKNNSIIIDHPMDIWANKAVTIGVKFPLNTFKWSVLDRISTFIFWTPEWLYGTKFWKTIKSFVFELKSFFSAILSIIIVILAIFSFLTANVKIVLEPKHLRMKQKNLKDVIHYTPPKWYSPIEVNLLYDRYPSTKIVTTALYTRVAEGYIKINAWWLKNGTSFELIKQKEDFWKNERETFRKDLEIGLWNRIIPHGITNINWSAFKHNVDSIKFVANKMFVSLRHELIPEVYYKKYENTKQTKISLSFFAIWGFFALTLYSVFVKTHPAIESKLMAFWLYLLRIIFWLAISYLRYYYNARKEYKKNDDESHLTDKWKEILEQIHWFRKFLLSVEDERLNKLLKEDPKYCEKMLPYAIALWLWNKWIKKCRWFSDKFNIETIPSEVSSSPWSFAETVMASGVISDIVISSSGWWDWWSSSWFDSGWGSSWSSWWGGGWGWWWSW